MTPISPAEVARFARAQRRVAEVFLRYSRVLEAAQRSRSGPRAYAATLALAVEDGQRAAREFNAARQALGAGPPTPWLLLPWPRCAAQIAAFGLSTSAEPTLNPEGAKL